MNWAGYVAVVAAVLALVWTTQRRLMYFPTDGVPAAREVGLTGVEPVTFETTDGIALSGWFLAASGSSPRVTVLVFNGNAGNRAHRGPWRRRSTSRDYRFCSSTIAATAEIPELRRKTGSPWTAAPPERTWPVAPDVDTSRLVYFGESLGTAVAVDLAAEYPPAALVLRSPFTSMTDLGRHHYPFLPVRLLLRDRFAAIDQIQRVRAPLLVIAGGHDRIVPIDNSRRLYDTATAPKTLLVLPNADHNDHALLAGDEMIQAIVRFLQPLM